MIDLYLDQAERSRRTLCRELESDHTTLFLQALFVFVVTRYQVRKMFIPYPMHDIRISTHVGKQHLFWPMTKDNECHSITLDTTVGY